MEVTFFQRKPRAFGNYSLEAIFADVRERLRDDIQASVHIAPAVSDGWLRRLWIMMDAGLHRGSAGSVNHVTGDIHFAVLLLPRRCTVLTVLDCFGVDQGRGLRGWIFRKLWFQWPVDRAAVITTISEASKQDILRVTKCDPSRIVVTGVAISSRFRRCDRAFNAACPRILQVGTSPNKNIERLAAALEGMRCRLVVIGALNASQRKAIERHRIDAENHRGLSDGELVRQYERCDVVAFASTFEGFGMPILEGNAVGRPVVTGNVAAMPEVAGNAACLVNPLDVDELRAGLRRVIEDADYRRVLVNNGFENVKRFDPEVVARRYLEVYRGMGKGEWEDGGRVLMVDG